MMALADEVREHDPERGAGGWEDGLMPIGDLSAGGAKLKPRGHVLVEIGHDQAEEVCARTGAGLFRLPGNPARPFRA
jgi:methylase of polypeptide subunit release factors